MNEQTNKSVYINTICTFQLMEKKRKVLQDSDVTFCGMRNDDKFLFFRQNEILNHECKLSVKCLINYCTKMVFLIGFSHSLQRGHIYIPISVIASCLFSNLSALI